MLLNAMSRQYILNEALSHAFDKRKNVLGVEYDRIAMAIYNALFTKTQQEHINALPKCFYNVRQSCRINVGGQTRDWSFNGEGKHGAPKTSELKLPSNAGWDTIGVLTQDKHADLIERISTYDATSKAVKEDRSKAETTLTQLLKGTKTLEQLKDVWPEGHKFYKGTKAAVPTPPGLPAIAMADLNRMLGVENRV